MKSHLIIPDAHCHYKFDNNRFDWLSRFILDRKDEITNIVCLGDFADLPSLSSHESGSNLSFEGRRLTRDLDVTHDGLKRLFGPIDKANRKAKKKFRPRKTMVMGNHEHRITRAVENASQLLGWLDMDILHYHDFFDDVHAFRVPVTIDGITYAHWFASGVAGRPISGESIGRNLCHKQHTSCVQGHSHVFDHAERVTATGQRIFGMSGGCFVHPDYVEDWCVATVKFWWRGITILHDLDGEGYYDRIEHVTLRWLERNYG